MADDGWDDELTIEFARELVARAQPDELPVLDAMAETLLREGTELEARSDGSLGFGIELVAVVSAAVPVAKAVGVFLVSVATSVAADAVQDSMKERLRKMAKRKKESPELPADVVSRAREVAMARAVSLGLDDGRASLLADAVTGALTTPAET